ncbi:HNH endonuclease [Shewanella oncorhynchi]|uniref:HNH endonuclease n=1 Tax=Shewanella oncorhynchi TaxID=2726434 RepID=UPI003D798F6F
MNSYFALHKNYISGSEFMTNMGYGFNPESSQNWFRDSFNGRRVPPVKGSLVYVIQRQKTSDPYQLVGKYKIINFNEHDFSWGSEKTHRAKLENLIVPKKPILLDDDLFEKISEAGHRSAYDALVKELQKQNSSFRQPLETNILTMLNWLLKTEVDESGISDDDSDISPEEAYKKAAVNIRKGQERFRKNVEKVWKGKQCAVTGINYEPLLIASHIVRFSECQPGEHWDGANGMFLTAHLDALFDKYMITFIKKEFGFKMKWSKYVDRAALHELNIKEYEVLNTEVLGLGDQLRFEKYMLKHNEVFERKNK